MFESGVWHQEFWRHLIWGCRDLQISNLRITTRPVTPRVQCWLKLQKMGGMWRCTRHIGGSHWSTYYWYIISICLYIVKSILIMSYMFIESYMCIISIHLKYTIGPPVFLFPSFPWQVLGVDRGASDSEIAKAYKKLALKCSNAKTRWLRKPLCISMPDIALAFVAGRQHVPIDESSSSFR